MRSPKVIHIVVLEPGNVTLPLRGKKDFADVIRCDFRFLKWKIILDHLGGPTVTTRVLTTESGRRRVRVRKGNVMMEAEVWDAAREGLSCPCCLKTEGHHQPRSAGASPASWKRQGNLTSRTVR